MYKPPSILKKTRLQNSYRNNFNVTTPDLYQTNSYDLLQSRPFYSPIRTPPRLRRYVFI